MKIVTALAFFLCLIPLLGRAGMAEEARSTDALQHRIARWIRPSIDDDEWLLNELVSRREKLPSLSPGRRGASAGYHSRFHDSAGETIDIVLDLGIIRSIDRMAVFPVSAVFQGETNSGYGFPRRFRVEVSQDSSFAHAELLVDSASLVPLPRPEFPVQVATSGLSGRFLRLQVLEHWQRGDGRYLTALGEIMVLSGGRNVAIGTLVDGDSFTSLPDWSRENLVDGQTDLGLPIGAAQSDSNGFLSKAQPVPTTEKWVQLELATPAQIEEVRLIPAEPFDAPSQQGHGFPLPILKHTVEMAPGEKRPDVFDDEFTQFVNDLVAEFVPDLKDDPWVMGYYYGFAPWMDDSVWLNDLIARKDSPRPRQSCSF